MASSSQTSQRHGWPKSAPPKQSLETSLANPKSNPTNNGCRGYRYKLPPHHILPGSIPRQSQSGKKGRHSIHVHTSSTPANVPTIKSSRASLPAVQLNMISSSQEKCNRRAVVIGATYKGTQGVRQKLENTSHIISLFRLLTVTLNFKQENVWILTDVPEKVAGCPVKLGATRRNILTSLKWLVGGSKEGDVLFLGVSGLGATVMKQNSHEEPEDCLLPTDYPTSSPIPQTHLASLITKGLHVKASLTALIDTKDCSKVLKLPYIKNVSCISRSKFIITDPSEHDVSTDEEKQRETSFLFSYGRAKREYNRMRQMLQKEERHALVSQFSQCGQVFAIGFAGAAESGDKMPKRSSTSGTLTQAFTDCILQRTCEHEDITYAHVLQSICEAVGTKRNSQLPQVGSSHALDLCKTMALVEDRGST